MRRQILISAVLLLVLALSTYAQTDLKKIKEWRTKEINLISVDRIGNFFLVQKNGKIKKYDPDGKLLASASVASPTLIEPWYHPAIFIYSRDKQEYTVFGRNFENPKKYSIEPAFAIEPNLVCPTHDNKLWIFDKADLSLKKINPLTNEVIQEFALNETMVNPESNFTYLREYLNLIFLLDRNSGILILNHLGKVIQQIEIKNARLLFFFGEDLYYLDGNVLKFFDLLTEQQHEVMLPDDTIQAIITDERIITVNSKNRITLYTYTPAVQ